MARPPAPWARQPGETEHQWLAFQRFLVLEPPRSLRVLAEQLRMSRRTLEKWSAKGTWFERARAWDSRVAETEAEVVLEGVAALRRAVLADLTTLRRRAVHQLEASEDWTPGVALRALDIALKYESALLPMAVHGDLLGELDEVIRKLEAQLDRETFVRVLRVIAGQHDQAEGRADP